MSPDLITQLALEIAEAAVIQAGRVDLYQWLDPGAVTSDDRAAIGAELLNIAENIAGRAAEAVTSRG